jgi:hypothetical protein
LRWKIAVEHSGGKLPLKIVETRDFKHYKTLEFKRDLSIALPNCDWSTDDPNALWKNYS